MSDQLLKALGDHAQDRVRAHRLRSLRLLHPAPGGELSDPLGHSIVDP